MILLLLRANNANILSPGMFSQALVPPRRGWAENSLFHETPTYTQPVGDSSRWGVDKQNLKMIKVDSEA